MTIVGGPAAGRTQTMTGDRMVIGRAPDCAVRVVDPTISRHHAAIEREGATFVLVDLTSVNGTFVEGRKARITRHRLRDGEVIAVGNTRLRVELPADPAAVAPTVAPGTPAGGTPPAARAAVGAQLPSDLPLVLTITSGPDRGMVYAPTGDVTTIGRLATSDVPLTDEAVSRLHASIKRSHTGYTIYDENSRNGIAVGHPPQRVASAPLSQGDVLRIGRTEIRIDIGAGAGRTEADDADRTVLAGSIGDRSFAMALRGLGGRAHAGEHGGPETATKAALPLAGPQMVLKVVRGPDLGQTFEPAPGAVRFSVGRSGRATYRLSDPAVSSVHFSITQRQGTFTLKDEQSRNGTFVDGGTVRISSVTLRGGETVRIGSTDLAIEVRDPAAAAARPPRPAAPAAPPLESPPAAGAEPAAPPAAPAGPPAEAPPPPAPPPPPRAEPPPGETPEPSRSVAAKERIGRIMKGTSLRPIRRPGTPRQWAGLALALFAVLFAGTISVGARSWLAAGPVSEEHADFETQCETCHRGNVLAGRVAMNAGCASEQCHAAALATVPGVRDDCAGCHPEHRGRQALAVACWDCHRADHGDRLMGLLATDDEAAGARLAARVVQTETGLRFSHQAHEAETAGDPAYDGCGGCHPPVDGGRTFAAPGHAECLDCHPGAVSADPAVARAKAGAACLECHTREDGTATAPPPSPHGYVVFSHADHTETGCRPCHARTWTATAYAPVVRTPEIYPLPMDACYTCHEREDATIACLDCHRTHHSFAPGNDVPPAAAAGAGGRGFNGFLVAMLLLVLGGIGYTYADMRYARRWLEEPAAPRAGGAGGAGGAVAAEVMPFPRVDAEACISCSSCYNSCPKEVLAGDEHGRSVVVEPSACIAIPGGCRICEQGCPTGAIRVTTAPLVRTVERPETDEHHQAKLPGLFLVGELVGAALIKTAINQGYETASYVGAHRPRAGAGTYDVIVVGAGPGGLGAALEAKSRGLSYLLLERDTVASTIQNYPRDKAVLAEPVKIPLYGQLPIMDASKEALIDIWKTVVARTGLDVHEFEEVVDVTQEAAGFAVRTPRTTYHGANVILAIGTRGSPRKLDVPGEDHTRVSYNLVDAAEHAGRRVLVVGGGDTAVEAAVALGRQPGTKVVLSYRKAEFSRVMRRNREDLDDVVAARGVELLLGSTVRAIGPSSATLAVPGGTREVPCDHVFALIGADPPRQWIESIGVRFVALEEQVISWS